MSTLKQRKAQVEQVDLIRTWGPRLARAIVVLVIVGVVYGAKTASDVTSNTHKLTTGQKEGCHRANVERANNNQSNYDDYRFFEGTTKLLKIGLAHPSAGTTSQGVASVKAYVANLETYASHKAWVPLSNCTMISPRIYEPPTPILFSAGTPPPSAFIIGEGE